VIYHIHSIAQELDEEDLGNISPDLTAMSDKQVVSSGPITRGCHGEEYLIVDYAIR